MDFCSFRARPSLKEFISSQRHWLVGAIALCLSCWLFVAPAWAKVDDDRYDGNLFVLYAGNGAIVPARVTLPQALQLGKPTVMVFYIDDSSDCKQYAVVVSRLHEYYAQAASFIAVNVDSITPKAAFAPNEPGFYYQQGVPQVVILDPQGQVVLNQTGLVPFEKIDDLLRQMLNLPLRPAAPDLQRRQFNEFSGELAQ